MTNDLDAKDKKHEDAMGGMERIVLRKADELAALRSERDGLRKALEYYADKSNYQLTHPTIPLIPILATDQGDIARAALAAGREGG